MYTRALLQQEEDEKNEDHQVFARSLLVDEEMAPVHSLPTRQAHKKIQQQATSRADEDVTSLLSRSVSQFHEYTREGKSIADTLNVSFYSIFRGVPIHG